LAQLLSSIADDGKSVSEEQMIEVQFVAEARERLRQAALVGSGIVTHEVIRNRFQRPVAVADDAVGDRERSMCRREDRELVV
jgi:hypothetical protein